MGRRPIVPLRGYKRRFFSAITIESWGAKKIRKNELGNCNPQDWPDGNAASVEIRTQRGFPQLLGKVSPKSGETFPHFHRPYWDFLLFKTGKKQIKNKAGIPP
jgi:hypothetical protein